MGSIVEAENNKRGERSERPTKKKREDKAAY